jgi:hypothetical protein
MAKLRNQKWMELPLATRQAMTMYPNLIPKELQSEVLTYAQQEGRRTSLEKRMQGDDGASMRQGNWLQKPRADAAKSGGPTQHEIAYFGKMGLRYTGK